jgi:lipoprotein NlpI
MVALTTPPMNFARLVVLSMLTLIPGALGQGRPDSTNRYTDRLMERAAETFDKGKREDAFVLLTTAVEAEPANARTWYVRGRFYGLDGQHEKAIADYDQALKIDGRVALLYQHRGVEEFKLGRFKESVADFDKYLELVPADAPGHWQRGIACYYAGEYEKGRKQFELHQTVNTNDVENAVWHFLCVARADGFDKARGALIRIEGDSRVPMAQIYALFAGKGSADDVLAAAKSGNGTPAQLKQQIFYAHLYLGLYYEAKGDARSAREHILKVADEFKMDHFMSDVAQVHAARLRKPSSPSE